VAVFGQVDGPQIKLARVAGLDADVRELFRDVHRQLAFRFFTARGAQNPAKLPFLQTKGANQKSLAAVLLGLFGRLLLNFGP